MLVCQRFRQKKGETYKRNWGDDNHLFVGDVRDVKPADLQQTADLTWASFPCQDLSLAGGGAGLKGERSGTFWPFWKLMKATDRSLGASSTIVLENVCGAITSHNGKDFTAICEALIGLGYKTGAIVIDAARFVPQSRPRLFVIGIKSELTVPSEVISSEPSKEWHPANLIRSQSKLSPEAKEHWLWLNPPKPAKRRKSLIDILEMNPADVEWHTKDQTQKLLNMMSDIHREKVENALISKEPIAGGVYKRTRRDSKEIKRQRAEVRFDGLAGCLRTSAGGSSRQFIILVQNGEVRSRLISARETARLMGLPDSYKLPSSYNEAYHLTGDGVVSKVVSFIAKKIISPVLMSNHSPCQVSIA